jgi:hypothetical protein
MPAGPGGQALRARPETKFVASPHFEKDQAISEPIAKLVTEGFQSRLTG